MKEIRDIAEFRSGRFKPILPDTCQVNPRRYGAELAFWLAGKLARQGVVTSYPVAQDWGWMLVFDAGDGVAFDVLCANIGDSDEHWSLGLARRGTGWFGRAAASFDAAQPLVNAIRFVLHAAVPTEDLDWRYDN
jgi:hypothetical protein